MEIRTINERIIGIKLKARNSRITITQIYAPTSQYDDLAVFDFYEKLDFIIGDFNAKLGRKKEGEETVIGNHGYGVRTKRGYLMVNWM